MIEADNLTMSYGTVLALQEASFQVQKGEVVGLLGPNGAGKSTTMKLLTSYLYPTTGTAVIGGKSVTEDPIAVRAMTGYLPEVLPLYRNMEAGEYLRFVGAARGLSGKTLRTRMDWVVERCGLKPMIRRPIGHLSKGYRQRTGLAQALIHDPAVVILDEPTSGLDPHQILEVRNIVRELANEKTVILSTHILQEAEAMAGRIIIINRGRIVGTGTMDELRALAHETNRVELAVRAPRDTVLEAIRPLNVVKQTIVKDEADGVTRLRCIGPEEGPMLAALSALAQEKQWAVVELFGMPYNLEETFLAITETDTAPLAMEKGGAA